MPSCLAARVGDSPASTSASAELSVSSSRFGLPGFRRLMKIGYARVSTKDQNLDMQRHAPKRAGCEKIFEDKISGAVFKRPGLELAMKALKPGDVLVVWYPLTETTCWLW
jgi:hypothetical protein